MTSKIKFVDHENQAGKIKKINVKNVQDTYSESIVSGDNDRMKNQLYEFLQARRTGKAGKAEPQTHTSMDPKGSYYIDDISENAFYTLVCNAAAKKVPMTITEMPGKYAPLRVDFDIKASVTDPLKPLFTLQQAKQIGSYYQQFLRESIDPEVYDDKLLQYIILTKKGPRIDSSASDGVEVVKHGFHLHFPHFVCDPWFQDQFLRPKVIEEMIRTGLWKGKYINSIEKDFIDKDMGRKPWLMYGSAKNSQAEPFLFKTGVDANGEEISLDLIFEDEMVNRKNSVLYYLPRFLSIRGNLECISLKKEIDLKKNVFTRRIKRKNAIEKKRSTEKILEDIKSIKDGEIMDMLSDERADNQDTWMDVGWTLFNIGEGCDEAKELWIEFSKRSPKFMDGECDEKWNKMELRGKTMGSLLNMAKKDNPQRYKIWKERSLKYLINTTLLEVDPNEYDVSKVIYHMYKERFVCAGAKKDLWYEFKDHRWRELDDAIALKTLFVGEVREEYVDFQKSIVDEKKDAEADESKIKKRMDKCSNVITSLKSTTFHTKLIKMCQIQFYNSEFLKKINENKKLFVCENGVIDLEAGVFRDGRPDDYMSYSCGQSFEEFTKDDPDIKDMEDFLGKVFPNKHIYDYYMDMICATMEGGNINKTFVVCTGSGNNAKSVLFEFMKDTFGDYCFTFSREVFIAGTRKNAGNSRPDLWRIRGRRLALLSELAKTDTIDIGVLKEMTGLDYFFARTHREEGADIRPIFTLWMQCNDPPKIPAHDEATWDRVRVADFESKFVLPHKEEKWPVPKTTEEQYKMKRFKADPRFRERLQDLKPAFLWMMFERYKEYKKRGLIEPKEVKISTERYHGANDIHLQFIQEKLIQVEYPKKTPDADKVFLKRTELFQQLRQWYRVNYPAYKNDPNHQLTPVGVKNEYVKRFGDVKKLKNSEGWYGWKINEEDFENDTTENNGKKATVKENLLKNPDKKPIPKKVESVKIVKKQVKAN